VIYNQWGWGHFNDIYLRSNIMRFMRLLLWVGICLLVMPTFAQDETPIDPHGEYTETYTMDNITLNYPTEMVVRHENHQIILNFSDNYTDTIVIATPAMFDYFEIAHRTPEIALRGVYRTLDRFSSYRGNLPSFEIIATETQFAGFDAMTFNIGFYHAYTFEALGGMYAAILLSSNVNFVYELELYVMERIVASITVDGEPIAPDFIPMPYANLEILNRPIPALYPTENLNRDRLILANNLTIQFQYPTDWARAWVDARYYYSSGLVFASSQALLDRYVTLHGWGDLDDLNLADDEVILIINPTQFYPMSQFESVLDNYLNITLYKIVLRANYPDLPTKRYYIPIRYYLFPKETFYILTQAGDWAIEIMGMAGDYDEAESVIFAILNSMTPIAP